MNNYSKNRKVHLCKYAKEKKLPVGGKFQGKETHWKDLILLYNEPNKLKIIEEYNLLNGLKLDTEFSNKLHRFAHHLTSSQILCYNYFRPMIDENRHPNKELIDFFKKRGIYFSQDAVCRFEYGGYEVFPKEGTEYDFHIKDEEKEVFIETKYTEETFGKAYKNKKSKDGSSHPEKFKNVYSKMIKSCACLKDKKEIELDVFLNNYQLFRNVLRITDKSKYTVFIFPYQHSKLCKEYEQFKKNFINNEYSNNVIAIHWEELMKGKEESELFKKYFAMD